MVLIPDFVLASMILVGFCIGIGSGLTWLEKKFPPFPLHSPFWLNKIHDVCWFLFSRFVFGLGLVSLVSVVILTLYGQGI